jgi:DMSO/TMAO reductase YedYZ molybdopterin-dependent catalytic subunit
MLRPTLRIEGLVEEPMSLDWNELDALCAGAHRVDDTSKLSNKVRGEGVRLGAVLARARPRPSATHVMVHDAGDYRACLTLDGDARDAVLAHREGGRPLDETQGGPVRLLVPTSDNACLSVKNVARIVLLDHAEADTVPRPVTPLRRG